MKKSVRLFSLASLVLAGGFAHSMDAYALGKARNYTVSQRSMSSVSTPATPTTPSSPPTSSTGIQVKGAYMSGYTASVDSRFNQLVSVVDKTDLNALVIDVKGDEGYITYDSSVPAVNAYKSDSKVFMKDIKQRMKVLKSKNIYTIARIVTFKDPYIAKTRPEFAMKKKDGSLYYDNGIPWVDPYKTSYWAYVISVAKEAAKLGFDEIQFDYVRFPTNGSNVDKVVKFDNKYNKTKAENIRDFLNYAKKELSPLGVKVSADIFGIATSASGDSGIGQNWDMLAPTVDFTSPMMYPSHYGPGVYGLKVPDAQPYETIKRGLTYALKREALLRQQGKHVATIRPWFQDFTASWVKGYIPYGTKEVNEQIRAAKELGVNQYLLWSPQNTYHVK